MTFYHKFKKITSKKAITASFTTLISVAIVTTISACNSMQSVADNQDVIKAKAIPVAKIYSQQGSDKTWQELLASHDLKPLGTFTQHGSLGAKVDINNALIETGKYGNNPINSAERQLTIHTLGNPVIAHDHFAKWSRWYQEDGNTQIFRLFKGETNVSNQRANAARVEAFSINDRWLPEPNVWREFGARFTVIKSSGCVGFHHCSIFQAKGNNIDHWSVMLRVDENGDLWYHPRRGFAEENSIDRKLIAKNVIGRPFDLTVLDNGLDYEMFIDGQSVGKDKWLRTKEKLEYTVIPLSNYTHKKNYGIPVRPSPNLPNDVAINLYPSLGLFEGTTVNAGRGTEFQFQRYVILLLF